MVHITGENAQTPVAAGKMTEPTLGHNKIAEIKLANGPDDASRNIDAEVVAELRRLIKKEFETNGGEQVYSETHYWDIMDEQSPATCWRYYLHESRKLNQAFDLMKTTLAWRKQNKVDELSAKNLAKEFWLKTPIGFTGKTRQGADLAWCVSRNYRKPGDSAVKTAVRDFITLMIKEYDDRHKGDLEGFVCVFDVTNSNYSNMDLGFVSWLISILDYFPRRFQKVHIIGIPFLLRPVIRLIIGWLPERYKRIVECGTIEQILQNEVDKDSIPIEADGSAPDEWRIAPADAPWEADSELFDEKFLLKLNESICFNTSEDRLESLLKMQRDFEAKKVADKNQ